jgi:prepilin-type N-terminal cleavage/methylation domain-containing protein
MAKAMAKFAKIRKGGQGGFSLLELLITVVILVTVVGLVVRGVAQLERNNTTQAVNVDLAQQSRQFMDQVVQDLHQSSFPSSAMFDLTTSAANPNLFANGLISISSTSIQYEGDVDGSGVSEVFVQLSPAGGPCPCVVQRGAVLKTLYAAGSAPTYYTEVDGVMNLNLFAAYDFAGNAIPLPCTNSTYVTSATYVPAICADGITPITNIKNIGILLNVQSKAPSPTTGAYTNVTVSTGAKISN